ncbi:hypothetical protein GGR51DRAFT_539174 [Nemania sp. FL0031]|nr:hypothetical protein GGR51DRAFT_539174 [Nemania sp. FL0031]
MSTRAKHHKSRFGCMRCKQRRVKCDEGAPCENCVRRREECSLSSSDGITPSQNYQPYLSLSDSDPTSFLSHLIHEPGVSEPSYVETWGQSLFLMSHFVSSTSRTFSCRMDMLQLWQSVVPEEAIPCRFLLHGILAVSALHLASLRPSQRLKYERYFRQHQNNAIPEYRRAIQDIKVDISGPIFAMAYLLAMLSLATLSDNGPPKDLDNRNEPAFDSIIALFAVIRGANAVLKVDPVWQQIMSSPYSIIISMHMTSRSESFLLPAHLQRRYLLLKTDCLDSLLVDDDLSVRKVLEEAIDRMESLHRDILYITSEMGPSKDVDVEPSHLLQWIALVPSEFVSLLRQKDTAALVIFSGLVVLFRLVDNRWFLKNWPVNVLDIIRGVMDPRGLQWLDVLLS